MGRVLVTGARGFAGSNISRFLEEKKVETVGWFRKPNQANRNSQVFVNEKITKESLEKCYQESNFAALVHCAGSIQGTPEQLKIANEGPILAIIDFLKDHPEVRLIFISSVSAIDRLGPYGNSKRNCEEHLLRSGLKNWVILRPSLIFGPGDTKNVGTLIKFSKLFPVVPVPGGQNVKLQPLFVDDLSETILKLINSTETGTTYTISGPRQERLWDMIGDIQSQLKKKPRRIALSLGLMKNAINVAQTLMPFLNLPKQQVNTLHNHPPWASKELEEQFGFRPLEFKQGLSRFL